MLRWSVADLTAQAAAEGLVESVSRSTARRWLDGDAMLRVPLEKLIADLAVLRAADTDMKAI